MCVTVSGAPGLGNTFTVGKPGRYAIAFGSSNDGTGDSYIILEIDSPTLSLGSQTELLARTLLVPNDGALRQTFIILDLHRDDNLSLQVMPEQPTVELTANGLIPNVFLAAQRIHQLVLAIEIP